MRSLPERVRATIRQHALFGEGDRLLVGLSGGADSVALLHLLLEVAPSFGAAVAGVAHLNHQLRTSAGQDAEFCAELARSLDLRFVLGREDVAGEARRRRTSIEDAARSVRYTFLTRAAQDVGATRVAVAHTRNDQAETLLLRLFRGAGPAGLAGILPRRGTVIRPLLDVTRGELEAWLSERGVPWREDPSNRDVAIPRNRIRHELLPWLTRHFGPGIIEVLSRQAALSAEDGAWLNGQATESGARLVLRRDEASEVDLAALGALPRPLQRRVVFAALRAASGGRFIGVTHVDAVLALLPVTGEPDAERGEAVDLPGQRVVREGGRLVFRPVAPDPGRAGRRRGRPVSKRESGVEMAGTEVHTTARHGEAEGATLKGHAPEGGRG